MDKTYKMANGEVDKFEELLGFPKGHISSGGGFNIMIPLGNEFGANEFWILGGYTSGGMPKAVIDRVLKSLAEIIFP